jgi:hypothetical protein
MQQVIFAAQKESFSEKINIRMGNLNHFIYTGPN